jgi:hypothetical protein
MHSRCVSVTAATMSVITASSVTKHCNIKLLTFVLFLTCGTCLLLLLLFVSRAADINPGWGMTFDPVDFTKFRGYECPANTYGESKCFGLRV